MVVPKIILALLALAGFTALAAAFDGESVIQGFVSMTSVLGALGAAAVAIVGISERTSRRQQAINTGWF